MSRAPKSARLAATIAVALCGTQTALGGGAVAELSVETTTGAHSLVAAAGQLVAARVRFDAPVGVEFNAAMFRIVMADGTPATQEIWTLESYNWRAPFVTRGPGDFSLHGLPTPLVVTPTTLQGSAYPIETSDIDFAVFDFTQYAEPGPTLDFAFRLPADAPNGRRYLIAAVPDQISAGFLGIPTDIGFIMDVLIGDPGQTPPTATLVATTATSCGLANGAIDVTVEFAQSVQWVGPNGFSSSSEDIAGLSPGTYSLQATGPGGTASLVVEVTATPDTASPVISAYTSSATAPAAASCTATVPDLRTSVIASDNCSSSAAIVVTQSPAPGAQRGIGTHPLQLTATDASGNSTTVTAFFTVTGVARTYYADADADGFGNPSAATTSCLGTAPAGTSANAGDCDDAAASINPARPELCDGIDNDCSGLIDDGVVFSDFYPDGDGDGFGSSAAPAVRACIPPAAHVNNNLDCNDAELLVRPGALERCDDIGLDNDCDGDAAEVSPNASDTVSFYRDLDGDGYGNPLQTIRACNPPAGHVALGGDCNDANPAFNPGASEVCDGLDNDCIGGADDGLSFADYFVDADADGYGLAGSPAVRACAPVAGRAANALDCNDANPAIRPGAGELCDGLDNNCDGVVDPGCTALTVYLSADASSVAPGDVLAVRVLATAPSSPLLSAQLALRFDATRLRLDAVQPVAGGPFTTEVSESIDNVAGTLVYAQSAAAGSPGMQSAAALAELSFTVLPGATACGAAGLVGFTPVGSVATSFSSSSGTTVVPAVSALGAVSIDGTAPALSGVPASVSIAADAGTLAGGTVAPPAVTATDSCDGALAAGVSISYPNGSTGTAWPSGGVFPVGTTAVTFSATDAAGNSTASSFTVTVANHQLLDATIAYQGVIRGSAPRTLRVKAGGTAQLVPVQMVQGAAGAVGIQVPVAAGYACMSAKDTRFSLTATAAPSVVGTRYAASFSMLQGDADDDDLVDIADFGFFFVDRGQLAPPDARSNYNGDGVVNNADFSHIGVHFFRTGQACGGNATGAPPRDRISVKELRRTGRGELVAADLNRDGWVDTRDMQLFMQGGGGAVAQPAAEEAGVQ